jgi:hypothetical protein
LYNFSSDTLFSTYCFEDQKDPIFGTNPDLFQPDLMHLYPNFDFLELDSLNDNFLSSQPSAPSNAPSAQSKPAGISSHSSSPLASKGGKMMRYASSKSSQIYVQTSSQPGVGSLVVGQNPKDQAEAGSIGIDYSDLSNFNTLVTVAAASPSISPRAGARNKLYAEASEENVETVIKVSQEPAQFGATSTNAGFNVPNRTINTSVASSSSSASSNSSNTIRNLLALNTAPSLVAPQPLPPAPAAPMPRSQSIGKNIYNGKYVPPNEARIG